MQKAVVDCELCEKAESHLVELVVTVWLWYEMPVMALKS
jgi:hypothetical protein